MTQDFSQDLVTVIAKPLGPTRPKSPHNINGGVEYRGWGSLLDEIWALVFFQQLLAASEIETWVNQLLLMEGRRYRCWAKIRIPSLRSETVCDTLTTFSLVCRQWRIIVVNSPRLWSLGRLDLHLDNPRNERVIDRSHHAPLQLYIDEDTVQSLMAGEMAPSQVLAFRVQSLPNLASLCYSGTRKAVEDVIQSILPSLPQLISLSLKCLTADGCIVFPQLPPDNVDWRNLRCLSLSGVGFSDCVQAQFCTLTDLTIGEWHSTVSSQAFSKLLQSCRRLMTLQLHGKITNFPTVCPADFQKSSIVLPHLELLHLIKPGSNVVTFLRSLASSPQVFIDQDVIGNAALDQPLKTILAGDCTSIPLPRRLLFTGMGSLVKIRGWKVVPAITTTVLDHPDFRCRPEREEEIGPDRIYLALDLHGGDGQDLTASAFRDMTDPSRLNLVAVEVATFSECKSERQITPEDWESLFCRMPSLQALHLALYDFGPVFKGLSGRGDDMLTKSSPDDLRHEAQLEGISFPCPNLHTLSLLLDDLDITHRPDVPSIEDMVYNLLERRRLFFTTANKHDDQASQFKLARLELCYQVAERELEREHQRRIISQLKGLVKRFHFKTISMKWVPPRQYRIESEEELDFSQDSGETLSATKTKTTV